MQRNIFLSCHIQSLSSYCCTAEPWIAFQIDDPPPNVVECLHFFVVVVVVIRLHCLAFAPHFTRSTFVTSSKSKCWTTLNLSQGWNVIWVTFNFMFAWTKGWKNQTWSCLLSFKISTFLVLVKKNTWESGSLRAFFFGEEKKKNRILNRNTEGGKKNK